MSNYIDGFVLPIPTKYLVDYAKVAESVAAIWKEHGAIDYHEYVGDDLHLEGTRSFVDAVDAEEDEALIFGWVVFESKVARDLANERVAADPRMVELVQPLTDPSRMIFSADRMAFGGFRKLV